MIWDFVVEMTRSKFKLTSCRAKRLKLTKLGIKIENHKSFNQGKVLWQSETANDDLGFCGGNDKIIIQIKQWGQ